MKQILGAVVAGSSESSRVLLSTGRPPQPWVMPPIPPTQNTGCSLCEGQSGEGADNGGSEGLPWAPQVCVARDVFPDSCASVCQEHFPIGC